jgi:transcriptional regulator with XRE-family HTH domain
MNGTEPKTTVEAKRREKGLTQAALGILAGLSPSTVSLIERTGRVSYKSAERLATVLGCASEELR